MNLLKNTFAAVVKLRDNSPVPVGISTPTGPDGSMSQSNVLFVEGSNRYEAKLDSGVSSLPGLGEGSVNPEAVALNTDGTVAVDNKALQKAVKDQTELPLPENFTLPKLLVNKVNVGFN